MHNLLRGLSLVLVLVLSLASSGPPKPDPASKTAIDTRVQGLRPLEIAYTPPETAQPLPWAAGQWFTLKVIDEHNEPAFVTYKILGQEDGAWWVEVETDNYQGKSAIKILMDVPDRTRPDGVNIRKVSIRDQNGNVTEVPEATLSLTRSAYGWVVDNLIIDWTNLPQEDVQVVAGTFQQAFKQRSTVSFMGQTSTSDVWFHPVVPINGMVKSVGVDNPTTMELVAFGTSGAASVM